VLERRLKLAANFRHAGCGVGLMAARVGFPHRRQRGDAAVAHGLRGGGIIDLAVAVAAVADQVDHHVAVEFVTILHRPARDAYGGVRIFGIHVENRDGQALGHVGSKARG
jgi:hypothetical protein